MKGSSINDITFQCGREEVETSVTMCDELVGGKGLKYHNVTKFLI
jgi:hypothetical protein